MQNEALGNFRSVFGGDTQEEGRKTRATKRRFIEQQNHRKEVVLIYARWKERDSEIRWPGQSNR